MKVSIENSRFWWCMQLVPPKICGFRLKVLKRKWVGFMCRNSLHDLWFLWSSRHASRVLRHLVVHAHLEPQHVLHCASPRFTSLISWRFRVLDPLSRFIRDQQNIEPASRYVNFDSRLKISSHHSYYLNIIGVVWTNLMARLRFALKSCCLFNAKLDVVGQMEQSSCLIVEKACNDNCIGPHFGSGLLTTFLLLICMVTMYPLIDSQSCD